MRTQTIRIFTWRIHSAIIVKKRTTHAILAGLVLPLLIFTAADSARAQERGDHLRELSRAQQLLQLNADSAAIHARRALRAAKDDAQRVAARELYAEALRLSGDYTSALSLIHI